MQLRRFLVVGTALALSACGSSSAPSTTAPTGVTNTNTEATASATVNVPAPDSSTGEYGQGKNESQSSFTPGTVTIIAGGTVTWVNNDITGHTTTSAAGGWNIALPAGGTFSRAFPTAGTFDYKCTIHPSMSGTITVK